MPSLLTPKTFQVCDMSSAKRKLFANGLSNANVAESEGNGSTENMVYTVVSEGDSLPKELESPRGLHIVNEATFRATLNKVSLYKTGNFHKFSHFAPLSPCNLLACIRLKFRSALHGILRLYFINFSPGSEWQDSDCWRGKGTYSEAVCQHEASQEC